MTDMTSARLERLLRMRRFIDDEIAEERHRLSTLPHAHLIQAAGDLYGFTAHDIITGGREVAPARQMACWLLHRNGLSYPEIGRRLRRDHTTVMYAVRAIEADHARKSLALTLLGQEGAA